MAQMSIKGFVAVCALTVGGLMPACAIEMEEPVSREELEAEEAHADGEALDFEPWVAFDEGDDLAIDESSLQRVQPQAKPPMKW